jgi:hypothetical protein
MGSHHAKVGIRQAIADDPRPHWHILSFNGPDEREARGVVDLIAVRKDHGKPLRKRERLLRAMIGGLVLAVTQIAANTRVLQTLRLLASML